MDGKILIVEDDAGFGTMLQKWFQRNGFSTKWCMNVAAAQDALSEEEYDMVLSDLRLPDKDGIMLLSWLKDRGSEVPVIIMTGYGEVQTAVSAIKMGAFDFLEKPINPSVLQQKIEAVFNPPAPKQKSATTSEKKKTESTEKKRLFVRGQSPASIQMYNHVDLVAPTQLSVMITGESGTGKEHVARLIHERSPRAGAPFIAVDCGGLSPELAPSELFGHRKGSFTSAVENKTGFFAEAQGGTLFLDEVGNLPYGVQMQMLRALQEKKIRPVGAATDMDVDVRIVTATNENLEKAIAAGNFREDLYHRLNEFMIHVPPLRDCPENIRLFADHFREEANAELDKNIESISPEALAKMEQYAWPGNLRELRNVVRRAALFTTGSAITPDSLPPLHEKPIEETRPAQPSATTTPNNERERIERALQQANGNKSQAARLLGIDRKTLYNKLHSLGMDL